MSRLLVNKFCTQLLELLSGICLKICWAGGMTECFDCYYGKLCGFQNYPSYRDLMWNFADEESGLFIFAVSKI